MKTAHPLRGYPKTISDSLVTTRDGRRSDENQRFLSLFHLEIRHEAGFQTDSECEDHRGTGITLAKIDQDRWRKLVPQGLLTSLEKQLSDPETLVGVFESDLEESLRFAPTVVVLTDCRVLSATPRQPSGETNWQAFPLGPESKLIARDHLSLGALELFGSEGRAAVWRYTISKSAAAHRFAARLDNLKFAAESDTATTIDRAPTVCPGCGSVIADELSECPTCQPSAAPPSLGSLWRLMKFSRNRFGMALLGIVLLLASTAANMVPPYITMPLVDDVLVPYQNGKPVDFTLVRWYLILLGASAVAAWLLGWARTYVLAWVSERVAADLRTRTYSHLHSLSLEFFGAKRTGDLMARLGQDTDRICYFLSVSAMEFVGDVVMIAMTAAILFTINPLLAALTLLPLPVIGVLIHRVRENLRFGFASGGRAWSEMTSVLADTIPGVRVVKAFAQERREIERFERSNQNILIANDRVNRTWAFFVPMITLLTEAGLLVVWASGAYLISQGNLTVGMLQLFVQYISRFFNRLDSMSRMVGASQRAASSATRVFEILDRQPSVPEPTKPVHPGRLKGGLELRDIQFKYGNRRILEDVSLTIRPGEMVGLVGASGAGKSTLANLVCRFYDVSGGAILADGRDIRSFPRFRVSREYRARPTRTVFVLRHHRRKYRLWPRAGYPCGNRRRRQNGQGPRIHPQITRCLRFAGRGAWATSFRW